MNNTVSVSVLLYTKWDKTFHFPTKPRSTQSIIFLSVLCVFVGNQSVQIYPVRSIPNCTLHHADQPVQIRDMFSDHISTQLLLSHY